MKEINKERVKRHMEGQRLLINEKEIPREI
jgi:hypothetical protein